MHNPLYKSLRATSLALCCGLIFLFSARETGCHKKNAGGIARVATEAKPAPYLVDKISKQRNTLNTLSGKAQIAVAGDGQHISVNANLLWIRDSIVWMNVKKFGLEAFRVLITKDSIFVLNRLEKTYTAEGLESLERQFSLPSGFQLIQQALMAQPWLFPDIQLNSGLAEGLHEMKGSNGQYVATYLIEDGTFRLNQEQFLEQRNARSLTVLFKDYQKIPGAGYLPYLHHVNAFSPESGQMEMDIQWSELKPNEPIQYRFEIPDSYEKR